MHSIVMTFRGADIKVGVANFCAAMDTLIDQDVHLYAFHQNVRFETKIPMKTITTNFTFVGSFFSTLVSEYALLGYSL